MLPAGASYIPRAPRICSPACFCLRLIYSLPFLCTDKGAAKIARQLGFDYAEAVVSELYSHSNLTSKSTPPTMSVCVVSLCVFPDKL